MAPTTTNTTTTKQPHHHERRKAAGIDAFTAQKGVTRSIQTYKHRKESKLAKKASLLREYHKVMKKEGLEAGRGKRKRDYMDKDDNTEQIDTRQTENDENHQTDGVTAEDEMEKDSMKKQVKKRKPKMNPLRKALHKATVRKAEQEQEQIRRQQELADGKTRMAQRKRTAKMLSQRTKKGQPVMKNVIADLLSRIEQKK
jgi:hypothetical protein